MSKFYVGQRVRVDCPASSYHGRETTIRCADLRGPYRWSRGAYYGHEVDIRLKGCPEYAAYEAHELIPIDDDDSRAITSWSQCVWKPNGVRA